MSTPASALGAGGEASFAPPAGAATATNADTLLVRAMGTRQLTASIFTFPVGSGIFALPAFVAAQLGAAAPAAYLLCAVLVGLVVLVNSASIGLRMYLRSRKRW